MVFHRGSRRVGHRVVHVYVVGDGTHPWPQDLWSVQSTIERNAECAVIRDHRQEQDFVGDEFWELWVDGRLCGPRES